MKYYARIKTADWSVVDDLTFGKLYPIEVMHETEGFFPAFEITDDAGFPVYAVVTGSTHLGGGDWEILSEDDIDALVDDLWETVD